MLFKPLTFLTVTLGALTSFAAATKPSPVPVPITYACPSVDTIGSSLLKESKFGPLTLCQYSLHYKVVSICLYNKSGSYTTGTHRIQCPKKLEAVSHNKRSNVARDPLPSRPLVGRGVPAGPAGKEFLKRRRN